MIVILLFLQHLASVSYSVTIEWGLNSYFFHVKLDILKSIHLMCIIFGKCINLGKPHIYHDMKHFHLRRKFTHVPSKEIHSWHHHLPSQPREWMFWFSSPYLGFTYSRTSYINWTMQSGLFIFSTFFHSEQCLWDSFVFLRVLVISSSSCWLVFRYMSIW